MLSPYWDWLQNHCSFITVGEKPLQRKKYVKYYNNAWLNTEKVDQKLHHVMVMLFNLKNMGTKALVGMLAFLKIYFSCFNLL